jgi:hypothetical protein
MHAHAHIEQPTSITTITELLVRFMIAHSVAALNGRVLANMHTLAYQCVRMNA